MKNIAAWTEPNLPLEGYPRYVSLWLDNEGEAHVAVRGRSGAGVEIPLPREALVVLASGLAEHLNIPPRR